MMIKPVHILRLLTLMLLFACEERYNPAIDPAVQEVLVVDGQVDNRPGPYTVKLSMTSQLSKPAFYPVLGYRVVISDDHGNSETLSEVREGIYRTSPGGIQGVAGRKYKVSITSPQGKHYESVPEVLRAPAGIDTVYHRLEHHSVDYFPYSVAGYRFFVSTEKAPADSTFFLWKLIDTWKYAADFNVYWVFDGSLRRVYDSDSLKICYNTDTIQDIFGISTAGFDEPIVNDYPLHWVSTETRKLQYRYSLLTQQYSVSREAFIFWNDLKEINQSMGELYSRIPYQIRGNIRNTQNPDEVALGYFLVAGITEKRIFADRPKPPVMLDFPKCELIEWMYLDFRLITEAPEEDWPVFGTRGPDGNALPSQWCMDCRESGGVLEKPDFWIE